MVHEDKLLHITVHKKLLFEHVPKVQNYQDTNLFTSPANYFSLTKNHQKMIHLIYKQFVSAHT